jgi:MATE family, multidrug efflux pump
MTRARNINHPGRSGVVCVTIGWVKLSDLDRRIVRLAIPALGTLAIEPLYILVDTAIVGRLGTDALAGLAIAATVLLTITALVMFLQYGATPDVAHARGRGDLRGARVVAADTTWVAIFLGVPTGILVAVFAEPLAHLLGGRGDVLDAATTYLRISAVGLPFVFVTYVGHGVMRGYNDLRKPLLIVLVANVVNVILEIIVVYGFDMGIAGSAWSTAIVQIGAGLLFLMILRPYLAVGPPSWRRMKPILARGSQLGLRSAAMLIALLAMTRVAAAVDTATLAAHQVLMQLFGLFALALDALAIPAQSLVAEAMGRNDPETAMNVGWSSRKLSLWVGVLFAVFVAVTSPLVPAIFTNDDAVASRVLAGLFFLAVTQIPGAVAFALDGVLIGGHDTRFLSRAALFHLLPLAPFLIATLINPSLGIAGLWAGELMYITSRASVNQWRFSSRRWMTRRPQGVIQPV